MMPRPLATNPRSRASFLVTCAALSLVSAPACRPKAAAPTAESPSAAPSVDPNAPPPQAEPLEIRFADTPRKQAPIGKLKRGVNLGNGLDAPQEGAWGVVLDERHFQMAREAGLDHVRLPVRFSAHASATEPFSIEESFFERVDWAIDNALKNGLSILVDLHHYEELFSEPERHEERFLALWRQIAERYKEQPDTVLFELLNEPNTKLDPARWNKLLARTIAAVRETNPTRLLVIDSYFWAAASYLKNLELPSDPNLVASFHMYQPILFTHQGAEWMAPEYQTLGVIFPGPPPRPVQIHPSAEKVGWVRDWLRNYNSQPRERNPSGPSAVAREFEMAQRYSEQSGRRVYLGEFGAIDKADPQSRVNYLRLVRLEAERRNIPWALWDDGGRNQGMVVERGTWVPAVRQALFEDAP